MPDTAKITYADPKDPLLKRWLILLVEYLTAKTTIRQVYLRSLAAQKENKSFWAAALSQLKITIDYDATQLAKAPQKGPLILIANHPYGVLDGLIICHLASLIRPKFKILINRALCREEQLDPFFLPVDFDESREAMQTNIDTRKSALTHLQSDGILIVFPAGGIATATGFGPARDLEWKTFTAKLIRKSCATVMPLYFHGQNSRLFQWVSKFSQTLRLALILFEVKRRIGDSIAVTVGDPIAYETLESIKDRSALMQHLREVTMSLKSKKAKGRRQKAECKCREK